MIDRLLKSKYSVRPLPHDEETFVHVQSKLALTPAEMRQSMERGEPISSKFDDSAFYDGDNKTTVHLDPLDRRGLDINDVWEYQQNSRSRIKKAMKDVNSNDA